MAFRGPRGILLLLLEKKKKKVTSAVYFSPNIIAPGCIRYVPGLISMRNKNHLTNKRDNTENSRPWPLDCAMVLTLFLVFILSLYPRKGYKMIDKEKKIQRHKGFEKKKGNCFCKE